MICCVISTVCYMLIVVAVLAVFIKLYFKIAQFWCTSPVCLVGKTAIVTGGCSGIGWEISFALAARGCKVIVADKAVSESQREQMIKATHNPNITFEFVDLASFKSVRDFVERIKKTEKKLDILINNAGIGATDWITTEDGLHLVMQVNYHSPFLLTHLLVGLLKKSESGARVIFTSSPVSFFHFTETPEEARHMEPRPRLVFYGKSKYFQIMTSDKLAEKLKPYNITSNSWHPLAVRTNIFQATQMHSNTFWYKVVVRIIILIVSLVKTPAEGAQTGIYLACADEVKQTTGEYFSEGAPTWKPSYTKEFQEKVWRYTEEAVKLRKEEKL